MLGSLGARRGSAATGIPRCPVVCVGPSPEAPSGSGPRAPSRRRLEQWGTFTGARSPSFEPPVHALGVAVAEGCVAVRVERHFELRVNGQSSSKGRLVGDEGDSGTGRDASPLRVAALRAGPPELRVEVETHAQTVPRSCWPSRSERSWRRSCAAATELAGLGGWGSGPSQRRSGRTIRVPFRPWPAPWRRPLPRLTSSGGQPGCCCSGGARRAGRRGGPAARSRARAPWADCPRIGTLAGASAGMDLALVVAKGSAPDSPAGGIRTRVTTWPVRRASFAPMPVICRCPPTAGRPIHPPLFYAAGGAARAAGRGRTARASLGWVGWEASSSPARWRLRLATGFDPRAQLLAVALRGDAAR